MQQKQTILNDQRFFKAVCKPVEVVVGRRPRHQRWIVYQFGDAVRLDFLAAIVKLQAPTQGAAVYAVAAIAESIPSHQITAVIRNSPSIDVLPRCRP